MHSRRSQEKRNKLVAKIATHYANNADQPGRDVKSSLHTLTDLCLMAPSSRPEQMQTILVSGLKKTLNRS